MLNVTIYPDAASLLDLDNDGVMFEGIEYVSLVNNETYGPPALIAPTRATHNGNTTKANFGEEVLYINTNLVPVFKIVRTSD